jgi:histidyl-tRNA synthetase
MQFQKPKGTRDFYPDEKRARNQLFDSFRSLATRYGYGEIETPAFEYLNTLTEKSGENIKEEIFVFEKRSTEQFGLRFDLTVPAARLFVQKQKELQKPVKWFYVDKMWRYENPQKGRLREFYQMGVELFGSDKPESDAETIAVAINFLLTLGLKKGQFILKLNNKKLLEGILESLQIKKIPETIRLIDKKKKMEEKEFNAALKALKLSPKQIKNVKDALKSNTGQLKKFKLNEKAIQGLNELNGVLSALKTLAINQYAQFDLSTARGLEYYTACIFECFDTKETLRSIFAGGRYDNLVQNFGGDATPAVGFAIGDATLQLLLEENGLWNVPKKVLDYSIVIVGDKAKPTALKLCQKLREKYSVDIDLTGRNIKQQLNYANNAGAQKVIFIGDNEIKEGKATVKELRTGKETKVDFERL